MFLAMKNGLNDRLLLIRRRQHASYGANKPLEAAGLPLRNQSASGDIRRGIRGRKQAIEKNPYRDGTEKQV